MTIEMLVLQVYSIPLLLILGGVLWLSVLLVVELQRLPYWQSRIASLKNRLPVVIEIRKREAVTRLDGPGLDGPRLDGPSSGQASSDSVLGPLQGYFAPYGRPEVLSPASLPIEPVANKELDDMAFLGDTAETPPTLSAPAETVDPLMAGLKAGFGSVVEDEGHQPGGEGESIAFNYFASQVAPPETMDDYVNQQPMKPDETLALPLFKEGQEAFEFYPLNALHEEEKQGRLNAESSPNGFAPVVNPNPVRELGEAVTHYLEITAATRQLARYVARTKSRQNQELAIAPFLNLLLRKNMVQDATVVAILDEVAQATAVELDKSFNPPVSSSEALSFFREMALITANQEPLPEAA